MTKRKNKQTQPESLSKREKQWLDKVDWDLLEQLEMEEEGQPVPMQDFPSIYYSESQETTSKTSLKVPPRIDPVEGIQSPRRSPEETKGKNPK